MTRDAAASLPITPPLVIRAVFFSLGSTISRLTSATRTESPELRTEDAKDCDEWVAAIAHISRPTSDHPKVQAGDWADPGKTQT